MLQKRRIQAGEKIGLLTIVRRWSEKIASHATKIGFCECNCDCGAKGIIVRAGSLRDKRLKQSCGCLTNWVGKRDRYKIGEIFGKLTIIDKWTQKKTSGKTTESFCKCQCECGKIIATRSRNLGTAKYRKTSCGMCTRAKSWKGHGEISLSYWNSVKHGACVRRTIYFDISISDAWNLFERQNGVCALSGVPIGFCKRTRDGENTASLDRIDSAKGYTIDNVQWVHKEINIMKWHFSQEKFIEWCRKVASRIEEQPLVAAA